VKVFYLKDVQGTEYHVYGVSKDMVYGMMYNSGDRQENDVGEASFPYHNTFVVGKEYSKVGACLRLRPDNKGEINFNFDNITEVRWIDDPVDRTAQEVGTVPGNFAGIQAMYYKSVTGEEFLVFGEQDPEPDPGNIYQIKVVDDRLRVARYKKEMSLFWGHVVVWFDVYISAEFMFEFLANLVPSID
jgi:hypothetical protein